MKIKFTKLFFTFLIVFHFSCSDNDEYAEIPKISPVIVDLTQVPYPKLSDYKFFEGEMKNQIPSYGVLPYQPISGLFTDYALKNRFIWLPISTKMNYSSDGTILDFPVGAALIKTFYYTNVQPNNLEKVIETRVMIRKSAGWIYANYIWNDTQTEAFFDLNGGTKSIFWKDENNLIKSVNYQIPSEQDCILCHRINNQNLPIGVKPQNLNSNYLYENGSKNQLTKFIEFGYLNNNLPTSIVSVVDYKDISKPLNLRVRSYFDANCAHCHKDGGYAGTGFFLRFEFNKSNISANMGVCEQPNHFMPGVINDKIVRYGDFNRSMLYQRMLTNEPNFRMPFKGRTVVDDEGLLLVKQWINSLTDCN